jgi:hypothetical protein
MELIKTFLAGKMNKTLDERLIPSGEYIDAMNIRIASTETSEAGAVENVKGNTRTTRLQFNGTELSSSALCIGAFADSINETIYWFVHSEVDGVDMIVSFNENYNSIIYHVVSTSVLNFSKDHLINGVNKIDDLLFFTDGYNPPRKINVKRGYPTEPELKESDISVIVAPPIQSPSIQLIKIPGDSNFIEDKFLSFATRYKYKDGEYSALSDFSEIAFEPSFFDFDFNTYQNKGMRNSFNAVNISFDTGGPDVIGIDLVYKTSTSPIINIIQKYNKSVDGIPDNSVETKIFNSNRILTVLPESELLRLFDNVPLVAKSQTTIGGRLFYGNYKDGNDLIDSDGDPVNVVMNATLKSEEFGYKFGETELESSVYNIAITPETVDDSVVLVDLSDVELKSGGAISVDLEMVGSLTGITNRIDASLYFELQRDYSSVHDMVTSQEFIEAVGSLTFHGGVSDCATDTQGISLTDKILCSTVPPTGYTKDTFGINSPNEGIIITATPGTSVFGLQMIAIGYESDEIPGFIIYEYFTISFSSSQYIKVSDASSLHSNRDFSVGIIYMDDFGRSTTVITSDNSSIYVPAKNSISKNYINVNILSKPPVWASRYKFAVMPSKLDYETVYSSLYFTDLKDGFVYVNLEGDNQNKVKTGDTLIVKIDSNGAADSVIKCDVLDISVKALDFIEGGVDEPAGLYMKLKPIGWSIKDWEESVLGGETQTSTSSKFVILNNNPEYPVVSIPVFQEGPTGTYTPWEVPEGSVIKFDIIFNRPSRGPNGQERYSYIKTYTAASNYSSIYDFVVRQNISFDTGESTVTGDAVKNENEFISSLGTGVPGVVENSNRYQFYETDGKMFLGVRSGTQARTGAKSSISASITLISQNTILVFETDPTDSIQGLYYIGSQSYPIVNGLHSETDIDLSFSDCFSFGNGVESYKVSDALAAPYFRLGQRVNSVAEQDFKLADRYNSITYSGVYNFENNINKLNEFNLSLANFKDLDRVFGPIQKISGRETDILVLQEDKISYVLVDKNLLSDAVGGGAISSVPEVLGTQVARIEEYGISHNPESFVTWGYDKFFTDAKRSSVIKLSGSGANESMEVISSYGMKPWFRDLFINSFNTRKLGGYDPYMGEYVLSSTGDEVPIQVQQIGCGTTISFQSGVEGVSRFILDLGNLSGSSTVELDIVSISSGQTINVEVIYDGVTFESGEVDESTSFVVEKTSNSNRLAELIITQSGGTAEYSVTAGCLEYKSITMINLCVNDKSYEGLVAVNETSWNSPLFYPVTVGLIGGSENPIVSYLEMVTAPEGFGQIPKEGATLRISSKSSLPSTFSFDVSKHKLRYLLSNTLYTDPLDIINNSTPLTLITGVNQVFSEVVYNNPSNLDYIYVVYDYRNITEVELCYSSASAYDACCNCE